MLIRQRTEINNENFELVNTSLYVADAYNCSLYVRKLLSRDEHIC